MKKAAITFSLILSGIVFNELWNLVGTTPEELNEPYTIGNCVRIGSLILIIWLGGYFSGYKKD